MIAIDSDHPPAVTGAVTRKTAMPSPATLQRFLAQAKTLLRLKGEANVLLTSDEGIRKLNHRFRKKNKPTDVLSFPAESVPWLIGDLAISVETARKQAEEQGHSLSAELKILMLHGLLHLAGYDHEQDNGTMARKEAKLRRELRLPVGLIERVQGSGKKAQR
jgi:probable rRNA maturation factor